MISRRARTAYDPSSTARLRPVHLTLPRTAAPTDAAGAQAAERLKNDKAVRTGAADGSPSSEDGESRSAGAANESPPVDTGTDKDLPPPEKEGAVQPDAIPSPVQETAPETVSALPLESAPAHGPTPAPQTASTSETPLKP